MKSLLRIAIMAEMHSRDLLRRRVALALLLALPLAYYLASYGAEPEGEVAGGVGLAFSVAGATLFSLLSSRDVDQRLVLAGYRPVELLIGRLLFLGPFGLLISVAFSGLMTWMSDPERPGVLLLAASLAALQAVALGLAIGASVPRELEGTLVLIGVVGLQLAARSDTWTSRVLPLHGVRRLVELSAGSTGSFVAPLLHTSVYGAALMIAARFFVGGRMSVLRAAKQ